MRTLTREDIMATPDAGSELFEPTPELHAQVAYLERLHEEAEPSTFRQLRRMREVAGPACKRAPVTACEGRVRMPRPRERRRGCVRHTGSRRITGTRAGPSDPDDPEPPPVDSLRRRQTQRGVEW